MTTEHRSTSPSSPGQTTGKTLLLASSDAELAQNLRDLLEGSAFQVLPIESADEVLARAKARQPHLILIDASLASAATDPTGLSDTRRLSEELKANPYTSAIPAVILSRTPVDEETQLRAFRDGADDYLVRPASSELFLARLRALLRRYAPPEELAEELKADNLVLDVRSRKVTVADRPVALTRKEFDLLNTLMRKRGVVVYTTHLYHTVWGYGDSAPVDSHTVKVHVSSLRSKLGPELGRKIVNLPGLGYRFDN